MPICDVLDELDLMNFVAGTMNPLSFRPYGCSCRPVGASNLMFRLRVLDVFWGVLPSYSVAYAVCTARYHRVNG